MRSSGSRRGSNTRSTRMAPRPRRHATARPPAPPATPLRAPPLEHRRTLDRDPDRVRHQLEQQSIARRTAVDAQRLRARRRALGECRRTPRRCARRHPRGSRARCARGSSRATGRRSCRARWRRGAACPGPCSAGIAHTPSLDRTEHASGSSSSRVRTRPRPSRSHCAAAPGGDRVALEAEGAHAIETPQDERVASTWSGRRQRRARVQVHHARRAEAQLDVARRGGRRGRTWRRAGLRRAPRRARSRRTSRGASCRRLRSVSVKPGSGRLVEPEGRQRARVVAALEEVVDAAHRVVRVVADVRVVAGQPVRQPRVDGTEADSCPARVRPHGCAAATRTCSPPCTATRRCPRASAPRSARSCAGPARRRPARVACRRARTAPPSHAGW